jgi:hypothetical protein
MGVVNSSIFSLANSTGIGGFHAQGFTDFHGNHFRGHGSIWRGPGNIRPGQDIGFPSVRRIYSPGLADIDHSIFPWSPDHGSCGRPESEMVRDYYHDHGYLDRGHHENTDSRTDSAGRGGIMKWLKCMILFFAVLSFWSSPLLWSQDTSSSRIVEISYDNWVKLQNIQTRLNDWQVKLNNSTSKGMSWSQSVISEYLTLVNDFDNIKLDLEKEKKYSADSDKKVTELQSKLANLDESLQQAQSSALKIVISIHIAWGIEGLTGGGLIAYGIYKGDPIMIVSGIVMVAGSAAHFAGFY